MASASIASPRPRPILRNRTSARRGGVAHVRTDTASDSSSAFETVSNARRDAEIAESERLRPKAAIFLASDDAAMITGTDLRVDAGAIAQYWAWDPSAQTELTNASQMEDESMEKSDETYHRRRSRRRGFSG